MKTETQRFPSPGDNAFALSATLILGLVVALAAGVGIYYGIKDDADSETAPGVTGIYYSPDTQSVFAFTTDEPTTASIWIEHHGSDMPATKPEKDDVLLLEIPAGNTTIFDQQMADNALFFTTLTSVRTAAHVSNSFAGHVTDVLNVYRYVPHTQVLVRLPVPDETHYPRFHKAEGDRLLFTDYGCYRCGAGLVSYVAINAKTRMHSYIGPMTEFEWLSDDTYRYKPWIADDTRANDPSCGEMGPGCHIPASSLEWAHGTLEH